MTKDIEMAARTIWAYMLMNQELARADAILALGSSDVRIAKYAAELYLDGYASLLIFSGGEGRTTTGLWGMSEAEKFASVAIEMGVPEKDILLEKSSTNTGENIRFTKELLEKEGKHLKNILLVQKPYMERRAYATFMKQWPGMDFIITSPKISFDEYPEEERSIEHIVEMMVGDLQRIREYPARGFQIPQEIPEEVWRAYELLVQAGYTRQLLQ